MKTLESALKSGCIIHGFRSGGGLRVFRLERAEAGKRGDLVAYGESATAEVALTILADDYSVGGRPYKDAYGIDKPFPHFLTGSASPSSPLDEVLLRGGDVDLHAEGDEIVATLTQHVDVRTPDDIVKRSTAGETVEWEGRGYKYRTTPSRFPNGVLCCSTAVIGQPSGKPYIGGNGPWSYEAARVGRGATIAEATQAASKAQPVELPSKWPEVQAS